MNKNLYFGFILLIIAVISTGCAPQTSEQSKAIDPELQRNRRLWQESKIADYDFEVIKLYGNWMPSLIQVRGGQTFSKQPVGERGPMDVLEKYEDFETVDKAFNAIQGFYDENYRVEVTYNQQFGYPEKILYDHRKSTDSVFIIEINKFEIVKSK